MKELGEENVALDAILENVMTQPHTLNENTIFTVMFDLNQGIINAYGIDSDTPYVG